VFATMAIAKAMPVMEFGLQYRSHAAAALTHRECTSAEDIFRYIPRARIRGVNNLQLLDQLPELR
jgi:hypothetical protein